jgi:hypothetical protein
MGFGATPDGMLYVFGGCDIRGEHERLIWSCDVMMQAQSCDGRPLGVCIHAYCLLHAFAMQAVCEEWQGNVPVTVCWIVLTFEFEERCDDIPLYASRVTEFDIQQK